MTTDRTLAALHAIQKVLVDYARFVDSEQFDRVAELFTPDGELHIVEYTRLSGRAAIIAHLEAGAHTRRQSDPAAYRRHFLTNVDVNVSTSDHATAQSYFLGIMHTGLDHWGRYKDELLHDGTRWRFACRDVLIDGYRTGAGLPPAFPKEPQ